MSRMNRDAAEDRVRPWEMSFNGRTWQDMPGSTVDDKKMNFFFYRRGTLDLADEEECERREEDGIVDAPPTLRKLRVRNRFLSGRRATWRTKKSASLKEIEDKQAAAEAERWKAKLRLRICALKGHLGAISRLAEHAGVDRDTVSNFALGHRRVSMTRLRVLEESVLRMERGELVARHKRGRTSGCVRQQPPPGHESLYEWLSREARRRGVGVHAVRMWMQRHPECLPPMVRVNKRVIWVPVATDGREAA